MPQTNEELIAAFRQNGGQVTKLKTRRSSTMSKRDWNRLMRAPEAERPHLELLIQQEKAMKRALTLKPTSKKMRG